MVLPPFKVFGGSQTCTRYQTQVCQVCGCCPLAHYDVDTFPSHHSVTQVHHPPVLISCNRIADAYTSREKSVRHLVNFLQADSDYLLPVCWDAAGSRDVDSRQVLRQFLRHLFVLATKVRRTSPPLSPLSLSLPSCPPPFLAASLPCFLPSPSLSPSLPLPLTVMVQADRTRKKE